MTADATPLPTTPTASEDAGDDTGAPAAGKRSLPRLPSGWRVVAGKEFADSLESARFYVLLILLGVAAVFPLWLAAARIRSLAPAASGQPAVFLALFVLGPANVNLGPLSL